MDERKFNEIVKKAGINITWKDWTEKCKWFDENHKKLEDWFLDKYCGEAWVHEMVLITDKRRKSRKKCLVCGQKFDLGDVVVVFKSYDTDYSWLTDRAYKHYVHIGCCEKVVEERLNQCNNLERNNF